MHDLWLPPIGSADPKGIKHGQSSHNSPRTLPGHFHKVTSAILTSSESRLHHMRSKHGTNAPSMPPQEKNFQLSRATSYPVSLTKQPPVFSASHHAPSYASSLAFIATRRPIPHVATIPAAQSSLCRPFLLTPPKAHSAYISHSCLFTCIHKWRQVGCTAMPVYILI